jgi:hypothetical protein
MKYNKQPAKYSHVLLNTSPVKQRTYANVTYIFSSFPKWKLLIDLRITNRCLTTNSGGYSSFYGCKNRIRYPYNHRTTGKILVDIEKFYVSIYKSLFICPIARLQIQTIFLCKPVSLFVHHSKLIFLIKVIEFNNTHIFVVLIFCYTGRF